MIRLARQRRRSPILMALVLWVCVIALGYCLAVLPPEWLQAQTLPILVTGAWSRATPPGISVAVAYLSITNHGSDDELIRVDSPLAAHVEIHETGMRDGLMDMRSLEQLKIAAGTQIRFQPNGKHLMLVGLKQPLKEGMQVPLRLIFRRAGAVSVLAEVGVMGSETPPVHH